MNKSLVLLMATVGSVIGGWLPTLFGVGDLSGWGIFWGTIGGLAGIWVAYKYMR